MDFFLDLSVLCFRDKDLNLDSKSRSSLISHCGSDFIFSSNSDRKNDKMTR